MEVKLDHSEISLIQFALDQKINLLKNDCMNRKKLIESLERKEKNYDVKATLDTVKMLYEDSLAELKQYRKVYSKFKDY